MFGGPDRLISPPVPLGVTKPISIFKSNSPSMIPHRTDTAAAPRSQPPHSGSSTARLVTESTKPHFNGSARTNAHGGNLKHTFASNRPVQSTDLSILPCPQNRNRTARFPTDSIRQPSREWHRHKNQPNGDALDLGGYE